MSSALSVVVGMLVVVFVIRFVHVRKLKCEPELFLTCAYCTTVLFLHSVCGYHWFDIGVSAQR